MEEFFNNRKIGDGLLVYKDMQGFLRDTLQLKRQASKTGVAIFWIWLLPLFFFLWNGNVQKDDESLSFSYTEEKEDIISEKAVKERMTIFAHFAAEQREPSYEEALKFVERKMGIKVRGTSYAKLMFPYPPSLVHFVHPSMTMIYFQNSEQSNLYKPESKVAIQAFARALLAREKIRDPRRAAAFFSAYLARSVVYDDQFIEKGHFFRKQSYHSLLYGLAQRTGVCIDKAAYAVALAQAVGIPARRVLFAFPLGGHAIPSFYFQKKWWVTDPTSSKEKLWKPIALSEYLAENELDPFYLSKEAALP